VKAEVEARLDEYQNSRLSDGEKWLMEVDNGLVKDIQNDEALQLVTNYITETRRTQAEYPFGHLD
jgi:hypothetical protein